MNLTPPSFLKFKHAIRTGARIHPVRDWFIVLGGAAILLGCSIGWNIWTYLHATALTEGSVPTATRPVFDTKAVEAVRSAFEARATEAEKYKKEYRFVDPSH